MEIAVISDSVTTPIETKHIHNLGFTNSLTRQLKLEIRAQILPIDAVAPPPVKPSTIPKTRTRKRSRVKRKLKTDGFGVDEGGDGGGFFGDGGGGSFGGGGDGGGFGGFNWDESTPAPADPAFDFVYAALSWFVLSNCLHFAFKRVVRIVVDGAADPGERRFR